MSSPVTRVLPWHLLFLSVLSLHGCKKSVMDASSPPPSIVSLDALPGRIMFDPLTGNRDTTLTIRLTLTVSGSADGGAAGFSVMEQGGLLQEGALILDGTDGDGSSTYSGTFEWVTQTSMSRMLDIHAYVFDAQGRGEVMTRRLVQTGFQTLPPFIESIGHVSELVLPSSGSKSIRFEVKAVHPVDQKLMDGVFLYLIDSGSNRIPSDGSTFRLYDDGFSQLTAGRDDVAASDSVYTLVLSASASNQPDSYTLHWFARDLSGLASDTLTTTLTFLPPP